MKGIITTSLLCLLAALQAQAQRNTTRFSIELEAGYTIATSNQIIKRGEFDRLGSFVESGYSKIGQGVPLNLKFGLSFNKYLFAGLRVGAFWGSRYNQRVLSINDNDNTIDERSYTYQINQYSIVPSFGLNVQLDKKWQLLMDAGPLFALGQMEEEADIEEINGQMRNGVFYAYKGGYSYGFYAGLQVSYFFHEHWALSGSFNLNSATYKPDYREMNRLVSSFEEVDISNTEGIITRVEFSDNPIEDGRSGSGDVIYRTQELYDWSSVQINLGIKYQF